MIDLAYLRHLRERHEVLFDRCLCSALLERAGFKLPNLEDGEIRYYDEQRDRVAVLRGENSAVAVLIHWPFFDLALERLSGDPSSKGVDTFKDVLGVTRRQAEGSFKRLVEAYHARHSKDDLRKVANALLDRTGELVVDHLRKTGRLSTVKAGPFHAEA